MNRIQDYYETAVRFLALPSMARYLIGTHFKALDANEFWADEEKASEIIFKRAAESSYQQLKIYIGYRERQNGSIIH